MDRTGYFSQKIASIMSNFSFREASIAIESILVSSVSDPIRIFWSDPHQETLIWIRVSFEIMHNALVLLGFSFEVIRGHTRSIRGHLKAKYSVIFSFCLAWVIIFHLICIKQYFYSFKFSSL